MSFLQAKSTQSVVHLSNVCVSWTRPFNCSQFKKKKKKYRRKNSIHEIVSPQLLCLSLSLCVFLSVSPSVSLSLRLSHCLSVCFSLSLRLSHCLSVFFPVSSVLIHPCDVGAACMWMREKKSGGIKYKINKPTYICHAWGRSLRSERNGLLSTLPFPILRFVFTSSVHVYIPLQNPS